MISHGEAKLGNIVKFGQLIVGIYVCVAEDDVNYIIFMCKGVHA